MNELPEISLITAGSRHSLLINETKNLYGWGDNSKKQIINDDTKQTILSPVQIGTKTWKSIAAGQSHSLAIDTEGFLWAWGDNSKKQLGNDTVSNSPIPIQIGTKTWENVVAGSVYSFAIDSDGFLYGWGSGGYKFGNGSNVIALPTPTQIGAKTWLTVACGVNHTLAIDTDGFLWATGSNGFGQLGNNSTSTSNINSFIQIGTKTWKSIAAGQSHSLAIDTEGFLWAWGDNSNKQLGDGTTNKSIKPIKIGAKTWKKVFATIDGSFAIDTDGFLWAWGGVNSTPTQIGAKTWLTVACGVNYTIAVDTENRYFSWGANVFGELGNGTTGYENTPTEFFLSILVTYYLFTAQKNAYTIADGILRNLGTITNVNAKSLFGSGLETITKEDCILVGQELGKAKIIKMSV